MDVVKVFTANMEYEVVAIRDMLLQNGIPAMIRHNELAGIGLIASREIQGWGDLSVLKENEERALELIAGFQGSLGELAELSEDELGDIAEAAELNEEPSIESEES